MRISDWSSDVCSSDLGLSTQNIVEFPQHRGRAPCRGGFSREFLAMGAANRKLAAGTEPAGRLYSGLRRSARNGAPRPASRIAVDMRSEEHTSELQSLLRTSYAVFCLKKKIKHTAH